MDNRCVCCGDVIPEGLQVCLVCLTNEWIIFKNFKNIDLKLLNN